MRSCPSRAPTPTSSGRASPPSPRPPTRSAPPRGASTTRRWRWPSSTSRATSLPPKPRIAVVGTPCEVQGLRAMQARRWPTGAHRVDAVVLTIALMCTKNFDYEALTLRELRDKRGVDLDRVSKMDVIHGRMIVEYRDGELAVDEPVKDFHGAALKGCDECADFLGRSADISVGSVGSMTGWTSVLIRTERVGSPSRRPGPSSTSAGWTTRPLCSAWTRWTRRSPTVRCSASSTPTHRSSSTSRSTCAPTTARTASPCSSAIERDHRTSAARARRARGAGRGLVGRRSSAEGRDLDDVLRGDDGLAPWLWSRWRSLASAGMTEDALAAGRPRLPARDLALAGRGADLGAVLLGPHRAHQPATRHV